LDPRKTALELLTRFTTALAERASAILLARASEYGLDLATRVPPPGKSSRRLRCAVPA
jgi:hypothetical protein